jgi:hypothetical protein
VHDKLSSLVAAVKGNTTGRETGGKIFSINKDDGVYKNSLLTMEDSFG